MELSVIIKKEITKEELINKVNKKIEEISEEKTTVEERAEQWFNQQLEEPPFNSIPSGFTRTLEIFTKYNEPDVSQKNQPVIQSLYIEQEAELLTAICLLNEISQRWKSDKWSNILNVMGVINKAMEEAKDRQEV